MLLRVSIFVLATLLGLGCGGGGDASEPPSARPDDTFATEARTATNRLRLALQSELGAALQAGGPVQAIEVCNTRAPIIAAEVSDDTGLEVARVSTRNRNPENAPSPEEAAVLAVFEARPALEDTLIASDGKPTYFRAIRIGNPACLNCHGPEESLDPALRERLTALYPDDRATGFAEGDLRGAFVVR